MVCVQSCVILWVNVYKACTVNMLSTKLAQASHNAVALIPILSTVMSTPFMKGLGIQAVLYMLDGFTQLRIGLRLLYDLLDRVHGRGVVLAAKFMGDLRETHMQFTS